MNRGCKIDFEKNTITQTNTFAKRARIANSPENLLIRDLLKQFPDFTLKTKAPANRENYTGLTIEFMRKCVKKVYGEVALAGFEEMIDIFREHKAFYAKIKKCLFTYYPECKDFIKIALNISQADIDADNTDISELNITDETAS